MLLANAGANKSDTTAARWWVMRPSAAWKKVPRKDREAPAND